MPKFTFQSAKANYAAAYTSRTNNVFFISDTHEIYARNVAFGGRIVSKDANYAEVLLGGTTMNLSKNGHTHNNYLPTSGGTVTGITNFTNRVRIVGTVATPAWNSVGITFAENASDSQALSLIYTSYDSYRAPAGIKLIGSQGNEWFEAPKIYATTFYGALSGNASTSTQLQTTRSIFGQSFNGTANVAGKGTFYGSAVSAGSGYSNGALQIREAGQVGNAQTSDQYAPRIGFHWANRFGYSLIANSGEFKFQNQAETGYVNIRANGFVKNGSSNAYALLGDGTHIAISTFMRATNANGYYGITSPAGASDVWIRTTTQGFIPYQSGGKGAGHGSLGTSSWYFANAYIDTITCTTLNGNATSATNADKVDNYHAGNASGQVPVSNGNLNTNLNAEKLGGHTSIEYVSRSFNQRFSQYNQGTYTKILQFTIPSGTLQASLSFTWHPSECARDVWADFNINIRGNDIMFKAIWKSTSRRSLWCVGNGTTFYVWVSGTKTSWDPYGIIQVTSTYAISSWNAGNLGFSDSAPTGTYSKTVETSGVINSALSAVQLQTARTLWGQSFNGTANVSGNMSSVGSISMNAQITGGTYITTSQYIRAAGELQSTSANSLRIVYGNYGVFWRNDGSNYYLMTTASGSQYGSYNSLRPFYFNLASGRVTHGHGLTVTGDVTASSGFKKGSSSDSYVLLGGGGHKAVSDFATSGHTHSYLPLSGGTMTGQIQTAKTGGTWINGKTNAAIRYGSLAAINSSTYWVLFNMKSESGHVLSFGGLGNNIGFYGYFSATTANQTDWQFRCDTTTGNWYLSKTLNAVGLQVNGAAVASQSWVNTQIGDIGSLIDKINGTVV